MFVRHGVEDYEAWRKVYDEFEPERGPMGVTDHRVFQAVEDSNDVTVWHDFDSIEKARALALSDKLRNTMQRAGVRSAPDVWLVTQS